MVHTVMTSRIVPLSPDFDPAQLVGEGRRWLIFTSANGVEEFFRRVRRHALDVRRLAGCSFAVIGPATGAALEKHGIFPDLCPEEHTSKGLALALAQTLPPGTQAVLLRSALGADILPKILLEQGMAVREVPLYTVEAVPGEEKLPSLRYLLFGSANGVEEYFRHFSDLPEGAVPVCMGQVTARRLRERTDAPFLIAHTPSVRAMVESLCRHVEQNKI